MGHKAEKGAAAGAALEAAAAAGSRGAGVGLDGTGPASQSQSFDLGGLSGGGGAGGGSQDARVPRVGESESQQSFGGGFDGGGGAAAPASAGAARQRRVKTQGEIWASALMKIDGCAEASALSIVRAHPTMAGLMAQYASPALTVAQKKNLLAAGTYVRNVSNDSPPQL